MLVCAAEDPPTLLLEPRPCSVGESPKGLGFRVQGSGSGFRVQGFVSGVQGFGFVVLGCRVSCLGFSFGS